MHREWSGSVFRTPGRDTWTAKYLDFGTEKWRQKKGFKTRADAREFCEQMRKEYRARQRGEFDDRVLRPLRRGLCRELGERRRQCIGQRGA